MFFSHLCLRILLIYDVEASDNIKLQRSGDIKGVYCKPKVVYFLKIVKIQLFCCFITQLVKKLQQWSLYDVIKDILQFV